MRSTGAVGTAGAANCASDLDVLPAGDAPPALWLPDVAQVRNPRLAQVLRACDPGGGRAHRGSGRSHRPGRTAGSRIVSVETTQGAFAAAGVVVAAGAWSGVVPGMPGLASRVFPVRGQMLLFKLAPDTLRQIVLHNGAYLIPRRDGHILAGSTLEWSGFDKSTTSAARGDLLAFAANILPALNEQALVHHWSGLRPGSPDNIPVIGRVPGFDNLYANSGHFRYGVTMAPGSAMVLADLIEGAKPAIAPEPYAVSLS
jgi:glycine oxidase